MTETLIFQYWHKGEAYQFELNADSTREAEQLLQDIGRARPVGAVIPSRPVKNRFPGKKTGHPSPTGPFAS